MGAMTGRAAGFCAGFGVPGFVNPVRGRGMGFGRGRGFGGGRGWRHRFYATGLPGWMRFGATGVAPVAEPTPEAEKNYLQGQAEMLQTQLDEVKKRLDELAAKKTE
jgi:hypothetical protein